MENSQKKLKTFPKIKINRAYLDKLYIRKQEKEEKIKRLTLNDYE